MKVLFLDIDGVVNCKTTTQRHRGCIGIDPYMAFLVGKIVLDTGCEIVLSSSWRNWPDGIREVARQVHPIFSTTRPSWYDRENGHHSTRGEEIQKWLDEWNELANDTVDRYAILDDDPDMLPGQMSNFFRTYWEEGITDAVADDVTKHLNAV